MTRYRLDDLEIDLPGQKVSRSGDVLPLPELSFQVLACLIRHAPAAVSTEVLSTEAWRQSHVTDDTIAQRIALIRKSLGDTARSPRYIRTLRGRGYTLAATLETLPHHDGPEIARARLGRVRNRTLVCSRPGSGPNRNQLREHTGHSSGP